MPGWPFPEHLLPPAALARLSEVITTIATELAEARLAPLCLETPEWNLETLKDLIVATLPEAMMVQRNRRRLAGKTSARVEIAKGIGGVGQATKFVIKRWQK